MNIEGQPLRTSRGREWTSDQIDELKKLYDLGMSCSIIASEMNCGFTRNAIIGKVHRLKLHLRGMGARPPVERPRAIKNPRTPRAQVSRPAKPKISEAILIELRCVEVEPQHVSIADLEGCKYPYGDAAPYTFCNHQQMEGSSYCGPHFSLSIGRGTASERAASHIRLELVQ